MEGLLVDRRLFTPAGQPGVRSVIVPARKLLVMRVVRPGGAVASSGRGSGGPGRAVAWPGVPVGAFRQRGGALPAVPGGVVPGAQPVYPAAGRRCGRRPAGGDPAGCAAVLLR